MKPKTDTLHSDHLKKRKKRHKTRSIASQGNWVNIVTDVLEGILFSEAELPLVCYSDPQQ